MWWWNLIYIGGGLLALLVVFLIVMYFLGRRLPEAHAAKRSMTLKARPEGVWELVANFEAFPSWAPGVTKVIKLEPIKGDAAFRQHMGRNSFLMRQTKFEKPKGEGDANAGVIERTIADDRSAFSGTWTYRISREVAGTTKVTLTEKGVVRSSVPRAMMHYLMGEDATLKKHMRGIAAKFGEEAEFE